MASRYHTVSRTTRIGASADDVFAWHNRPGALERLTPPWQRLEVVDHRGGIEEGTRVALRIRHGPLRLRWIAVHRDVVPGREFRDEQVEGPFAHWVHTHRMEPLGADACQLTDEIEYLPPLGNVGALAGRALRRRLERMLAYRHAVLAADLAAHRRFPKDALHVAVTGSHGLIGSSLVPFLTAGGHRVTRVVRGEPAAGEIAWNPATGRIDARAFDGVDAVVHLAGENLSSRRWTENQKRELIESRTQGTRLLSEALARIPRPPAVLVSASAIHIYGDRGDEPLDERSPAGTGFLAELCRVWERAAEPAYSAGVRVVHPRFGVVLSPAGGALAQMLPPFRAGLGATVGDGCHWMSWVSIDDAIGAVYEALGFDTTQGAMNVVSPDPVRNAEFTAALARALGRPALLSMPAAVLRARYGAVVDEVLLTGVRAYPRTLADTGYPFRHPRVEAALAHVLGADP